MSRPQGTWMRLKWLVVIWLASVLSLGMFAYGFRLLMTAAGMTV